MQPRNLTIACARCGRAAAEFALLPAEAGGEGRWAEHDRLERTDFIGTVTQFGTPEQLLSLFDALARADYAAVRQTEADLVAFICRTCCQPYCDQCWQLEPPSFDEGFYDCTYGVCPHGHRQMVDD